MYSWGANSYGQLATGDHEDELIPKLVTTIDFQPLKVIGGGGHTIFITEQGSCYCSGQNNKGQLGLGQANNLKEVLTPQILPFDQAVVKAAAGWDFTFIITAQGEVYGFGSNTYGQLGFGETKDISTPQQIKLSEDVKTIDVACGMRHTLLLLSDGSVYASGSGKKGQLGLISKDDGGPCSKCAFFQKVTLPESCGKALQVAVGAYHSAALSDSGQVVIWGDNKYGQLALPPHETPSIAVPTIIENRLLGYNKIVELHSGWTHVLAISESGQILTWGRADYGQTGRENSEETSEHQWLPGKVDIPRAQQVACGAEHNVVLTESGIYSWGWNEHGICATGDEVNVPLPRKVTFLDQHSVKAIGCGAGFSFVICFDQ